MDSLAYGCSLLKQKLGDIPFQVWGHNDNTNETIFLGGEINSEQAPGFLEYKLNRPALKAEKMLDKVIIYYLYKHGYQIAICIFNKENPLTDEDMKELFHLMRIYKLEEVIQKRDTELHTIIDSMHSISASLQLNQVLENIIKNALKVIPASDAGYLLLFDESQEKLIPQVQVGFNESIYNFQPKIGESITGTVFKDGKGRIFNSKTDLYKQMETYEITEQNLAHLEQATPSAEGAICAPISIGDKHIGVVIIHQWKIKRKLTEHDLELLEGFARQAGIAIQNAKYHMETTERLNEITALSEELETKNSQLQHRYDVHERFMNISLKNKGADVLIHELRKLLNQPVLFFSHLEHSFYSANWGEKVFSIFEIKTIFSNQSKPVHVRVNDKSADAQSFCLYPLFNGTLFLGCFILRTEDSLTKSERITLEQGATSLALDMINKKANTQKYQLQMYDRFQDLLRQENKKELVEHVNHIGLNTSSYWMAAKFELLPSENDVAYIDFDIYQLTSQIEKTLVNSEKIIYSSYNEVVIFISLSEPSEAEDILEKFIDLKEMRFREGSPVIRGGLSNPCEDLEQIHICYEEASKAIAYLSSRDQADIITYDEIGLNRLFIKQPPEEIDKFINEVFAPLRVDNDRHKELEKTLVSYIHLNRSAAKTAEKLHIHINTLYQRLRSIEEILQVDLNDSEDNLEIQLACHLKMTRELSH